MAHGSSELRSVCFGEFVFDPQRLDLRRDQKRIRLREQPLRVLAALIERPDSIVAREELYLKLWPADTQLDCDHSLNNAINQLREALADSAANPKFIETIPRRGYRFIGKIGQSGAARNEKGDSTAKADHIAEAVVSEELGASRIPIRSEPRPRHLNWRFTAAASAVFAFAALWLFAHFDGMFPARQLLRADTLPAGVTPAAYTAYRRGRDAWGQRTLAGYGYALDYFNRAVEIDPSYAEAYSGLADTYALLASGGGAPYTEAYPKAREMAEKAISLNSNIAEAHASLAFVEAFYDWKFAGADKEFRRAIEINPDYGAARHWFGMYLSMTGRNADAIAQLEAAVRLDPNSALTWCDLGDAYRRAGLYETARFRFLQALRLDPRSLSALHGIGMLDAIEHRFAEAEADSARLKNVFGIPFGNDDEIVVAYARMGDRDHALAVLHQIERDAAKLGAPVPPMPDALAALGENDKAIACLEQGVQRRADWVIQIIANPAFDSLRGDPRFQKLLQQLGAPR